MSTSQQVNKGQTLEMSYGNSNFSELFKIEEIDLDAFPALIKLTGSKRLSSIFES